MADLELTVSDLALPLAEEADVDLVAVEIKGEGSRRRVRVVVDRKGGVDVGTCQRMSKALSRSLDEMDPVNNRYTLEVTSPGIDRPLNDQRSFDRVEGRLVKAVVTDGEDETREVRGTVTRAEADVVVLTDASGTDHELAYEQIIKATQELPW
jgi:ribosome maturation factor RimP